MLHPVIISLLRVLLMQFLNLLICGMVHFSLNDVIVVCSGSYLIFSVLSVFRFFCLPFSCFPYSCRLCNWALGSWITLMNTWNLSPPYVQIISSAIWIQTLCSSRRVTEHFPHTHTHTHIHTQKHTFFFFFCLGPVCLRSGFKHRSLLASCATLKCHSAQIQYPCVSYEETEVLNWGCVYIFWFSK